MRRLQQSLVRRAEVDVKLMYPGFRVTESDKVVQVAMEAAVTAIGVTKLCISGGGSDANIIAGFGIPTVNLSVATRKFIQQMNVCRLKN